MDIIQPTKDQLNQFVLTNHGSFQQSWQWGELQERMRRPVRRFLFTDGGLKTSVTGATTFVRHDLKFGKYYWLCPRGPVGNFQFSIFNFQKELGGIFIRIEPEEPNLQLTTYNFLKAPKDHNPRATVIVDLTKSEDEMQAAMHPKTRYNLRLAQKKELQIKNWIPASAGMGEMWSLMEKTAKRDKFFLHPKKYYEELLKMPEVKLFGVVPPQKSPPMLGGEGRGKSRLIAAAMVSFWGQTATYLHGASDYEHRALMAPYLLHWEVIRHAKAEGLKYYDFGGVAPKDEPDHFLGGVTRFKSGWGGEYVEHAGSWDYVLDRKWYWVYKMARNVF